MTKGGRRDRFGYSVDQDSKALFERVCIKRAEMN
jgi:hypothetical protein